ncbi:MAG: alkaline phosphatase family protein [Pseudomonadota bacterium]|nr:alkaline phosphatase family protein [Pseudomonadota bacterium]
MRRYALLVAALATATSAAAQPQPRPPRLVVVISVDQLSSDLFDEYRPHFTGGLARLSRGTVFRNGYQGQSATETCPGHSTILTGALPARSGIVANQWIDQSIARADKQVYCAEDERVPGSSSDNYSVSPAHLKVPTLGDLLKRHAPGSQNVAIAGKDRSAVMMSGHSADQRWYWKGQSFATDLARAPVPPSVGQVNGAVRSMIAAPEQPLEPPAFCRPKSGAIALPDGNSVGGGRFARSAGDSSGFRRSPALDGATLALAGGLIRDSRLGQDETPDILSIGLAATDYVGHAYGTQGQEMCLQLFSLDRDLGSFLQALDQAALDYAVVLTSDHGAQDLPERARASHPQSARIDPALSAEAVGKAIGAKLGLAGPVLLGGLSGDVYIDRKLSAAQQARARTEAAAMFRAHPQVAAVFTAEELERAPIPSASPDRWSLIERVRASFHSGRSGDLIVVPKERITPIDVPEPGYVATHGTPWDYDRRIPILFWRPGMSASERPEAVGTVDIMPTIASMIGMPVATDAVDGRCLEGVLEGACPKW